MAQCPLEIPQCKRNIMTCKGPFQRIQCPLNVKTPCTLAPPACPLLPQQDNVCGMSKMLNPEAPLEVNKCPCKCVLAPPGCPISMNKTDLPREESEPKEFPSYYPQCPMEDCNRKNINVKKVKPVEEKRDIKRHEVKTESKDNLSKDGKVKIKKKLSEKCSVSSSRRPLPCAECILQELSPNADDKNNTKKKMCPFLAIADTCGALCKCEQVVDIDSGPRCPFLPKPCPCCTTPRCPLSKDADCPLKPKPCCQATCSVPPCNCGVNCMGETFPNYPEPPPNPPNPPRCVCGGCPVGSPCPFKAPKCVCGSCPLLFPCCSPKPCTCMCGMCPIGKILCLTGVSCPPSSCPLKPPAPCPLPPACPLKPPSCPLSAPPCSLACDPCPLLKNPICPPIPLPCSLDEDYELKLEPPKTTFHIPTCPIYEPQCKIHLVNTGDKDLICPFSPHPCPLGPTCPFPISNTAKKEGKAVPRIKETSEKNLPSNKTDMQGGCPGSNLCGIMPYPECPAAEILFPDKYKKKVKPKKEPCPLKGCMRKPECPLNKAMPNVVCPMADNSDCPLSKEPDCPIIELVEKCPMAPKCPFLPPPQCPFENKPKKSDSKGKLASQDCPLTSLPDCLKGVLASNSDCPLAPKPSCPLAPKPSCPLAPKPSCPLAPKPSCPLAPMPSCPLASKPESGLTKSQTKIKGDTEDCPLSNLPSCLKAMLATNSDCPLVPKIDCPLVPKPECPLAPKPECPLAEFAPKSNCPMAGQTCPLTSSQNCPLSSSKCPMASLSKPMPNKDGADISNISSKCVLSSVMKNKCGITKTDGPSSKSRPLSPECPLTPFIPKLNCPLAPPPCPLTPKPKCPLTKKPDPCPLTLNKLYCPVEYPPCNKFPDGRCPMGNLNICDCEYPVCPCLVPFQEEGVIAPPQYCMKENCCMGLGRPPPVNDSAQGKARPFESDDGTYYQFKDTKPGKEETKHFIQISSEPPHLATSLLGPTKARLHDNWTIHKYGEGFKKCKNIAKKLEALGPIENKSVQYFSDDCLLSDDAILFLEATKKFERDMVEINNLKRELNRS